MTQSFSFAQFLNQFPTDDICLEEIKLQRFPAGTRCWACKRITNYYKLKNRNAYSCQFCGHQIYPLATTIFEKSTTPLRLWFYAMYLMTQTKGGISITQLQKELGVTYKTAWRISTRLRRLMEKSNGDLLAGAVKVNDLLKPKVSWTKITIFNQFEIKITEKEQSS